MSKSVFSLRNYAAAVDSGAYERDTGGLFGKYDNVRRFWEDQINRYTLRDFLFELVARKHKALSRVRVIDLGCGAGEGYEILTNVHKGDLSLSSKEVDVMRPQMIGEYRGVDISPAMVEKARQNYAANPKLHFEVADLNEGLPVTQEDPPYDIYFSSFGSLSHLEDDAFARVIEDICDHMGQTAIFVADLVGRYSYEWQCYWDDPEPGEGPLRPYSMSYIYPPHLRDNGHVERFPLRFWGGEELDAFVTQICERKGVTIARRQRHDRSILVGRHMNTGELNPHAQPIREAVCSLHEFHKRTDLDSLLFDYFPHPHHPELNRFFEQYQMAWNAVVFACKDAVENYDDPEKLREEPPQEYPEVVQHSIRTIRSVVANLKWFRMGDPLANIVEPQLGYVLRNLESDLQNGAGAAHGLLATYEFVKE
jgi:SAM-dependent methyltransferase